MKAVIKGAVVGGVIGLVAPVALAVGNEFLWSRSSGGTVEPRICFAERLWNLQRIQVKHAPGCKNKILESTPQILLVSVLGGSLLGALSLIGGKAQAEERTPRPSLLSKPQEEKIETPKPQEPVASNPPSVEPVSKRLSEGFDIKDIFRMSAVGGAVALVGWWGITGIDDNTFRGKRQESIAVLATTSKRMCMTSYDCKDIPEYDDNCISYASPKIPGRKIKEEEFTSMLESGGEIVSSGEKTVTYYNQGGFVMQLRADCHWTPYIIKI